MVARCRMWPILRTRCLTGNRPIQSTYGEGSKWYTWLVEDQRFVSGRKDLANFETPVLDHDVTVTGDVMADICSRRRRAAMRTGW